MLNTKAAKRNHIITVRVDRRCLEINYSNHFALEPFKLFRKLSFAITNASFQLNGIDGGATEYAAIIELVNERYLSRNYNNIAIFHT